MQRTITRVSNKDVSFLIQITLSNMIFSAKDYTFIIYDFGGYGNIIETKKSITGQDNDGPGLCCFTLYKKPALDKDAPAVPGGDFVAKQAPMYYVSVDTSGRLGWESETLVYETTTAHVVEVLTGKASNAYKAFLRSLGISYILAGEEMLDYALALEKLKALFGIETLMLGGGGVLNWSFIQAGLCDEISVVVAPCADGSTQTPALFSAKEDLSDDSAVGFTLMSAEVKDGGSVWLRYRVP